jgi:hypothetical protein
MPEAKRARLIEAAFELGPDALDNYVALLDVRLLVFEQRYEAPTSHLAAMLDSGRLHDTADVTEWLFLARLRSDLARKARS